MKFKSALAAMCFSLVLYSFGALAQESCGPGGNCANESGIFQKVLQGMHATNCFDLDLANPFHRQAKPVADAAFAHKIDADAFVDAFKASCDYNNSLAVAQNKQMAAAYVYALEASNGPGVCHRLADWAAVKVAEASSRGEVDLKSFKKAYLASCDYPDTFNKSLAIAKSPAATDAFVSAIQSSEKSDCYKKLTLVGATRVAEAVQKKEIDLKSFNEAYAKSCDFGDSMALSQCQGIGSLSLNKSAASGDSSRENNSALQKTVPLGDEGPTKAATPASVKPTL